MHVHYFSPLRKGRSISNGTYQSFFTPKLTRHGLRRKICYVDHTFTGSLHLLSPTYHTLLCRTRCDFSWVFKSAIKWLPIRPTFVKKAIKYTLVFYQIWKSTNFHRNGFDMRISLRLYGTPMLLIHYGTGHSSAMSFAERDKSILSLT